MQGLLHWLQVAISAASTSHVQVGWSYSPQEGLVFNLLPPSQVYRDTWLSPGKHLGKEATRPRLPPKASGMQLFSEFSQMTVLFSEIRITQHTLHKQGGEKGGGGG